MTTTTPSSVWTHGPVTLHTGDATRVLSTLDDHSVGAVVTSPPYWCLRDYGTGSWSGGRDPGCAHRGALQRARQRSACLDCGAVWTDLQHGLEPTLDDYLDNLVAVFGQLRRVLAADGVCWLVMGDTYAANTDGYHRRTNVPRGHQPGYRSASRLPAKNLLGVPWRLALALQADGWYLRQAIVWHKPNAIPESVTDRPACRHEYVFLLTASARYWFNLDPIREPLRHPHLAACPPVVGGHRRDGLVGASARRGALTGAARPDRGTALAATGARHAAAHPAGRNPGSVWSIPTAPGRHGHPAAFPVELARRCIAAGCRPATPVLDPFSGTATTGVAALQLGHRYVGIELNQKYTQIGKAALLAQMQRGNHAGQDRAA